MVVKKQSFGQRMAALRAAKKGGKKAGDKTVVGVKVGVKKGQKVPKVPNFPMGAMKKSSSKAKAYVAKVGMKKGK